MAKHGKNTSTSTTSTDEAQASEAKAPRGPSLMWNRERDAALVIAIRDNPGISGDELTATLQSDPAFSGVESLVTRSKITNRATTLRQAGVSLPARLGGSGYSPEKVAGELNALLGAGGAAGGEAGAGSDEDEDAGARVDFDIE